MTSSQPRPRAEQSQSVKSWKWGFEWPLRYSWGAAITPYGGATVHCTVTGTCGGHIRTNRIRARTSSSLSYLITFIILLILLACFSFLSSLLYRLLGTFFSKIAMAKIIDAAEGMYIYLPTLSIGRGPVVDLANLLSCNKLPNIHRPMIVG